MSSSQLTFIQIGSGNRADDCLRAEIWRTVNAVGNCLLVLRNTNGKYNGVFDVQDTITITVVDPDGNNQTMFRGRVDGPSAVNLRAVDGESDWDEYVIVRGVDRWQDVLFHNDYEHQYSDSNMQIKELLGDLFDIPQAIDTNIFYNTPAGATPVIGSTEFREGTSFLSTLQDALRRAEWNSYVDDALNLRAGAPGFSATGEILTNAGVSANIIDIVDLVERDGDKIYNYIKLIGKNPLFDAYTEENSSVWTSLANTTLEDSTSNVKVGAYSQRCYNDNPANRWLVHQLECPIFDYTTWNFTKGEIGFWGYYDNQAASGGGDPGAGSGGANEQVEIRLRDSSGGLVSYFGDSTQLYRGEWGWVSAKLGERTHNTGISADNKWWYPFAVGDFDWENVTEMAFYMPKFTGGAANTPSNFFIDGISLPIPAISIRENGTSQSNYRRRPLVLNVPHLQTQNVIDSRATQLLTHHEATGIDFLKLMVQGNVNMLYAGQSYTVNIADLGLSGSIFYSTQIHHVIEPRVDVTDGYGFDFITEVEGAPIFGVAYDRSRLGDRQVYSSTQIGQFSGGGLRLK